MIAPLARRKAIMQAAASSSSRNPGHEEARLINVL